MINTKPNTQVVTHNTKNKSYIDKKSECCSVVVHVSENESTATFRRDSIFQATINIEKTQWYGTNIIKQSKSKNGYFVHSIITQNGWVMGFGGTDMVKVQANIIKTAGKMYSENNISYTGMNKIYNLVKTLRIGHAVIKSPNGTVGVAIYNNGGRYFITKLANGEYVCVPNNIKYYKRGYYQTFSKDAVNASMKIARIDKYGINRRNILTYHTKTTSYSQQTKIYVTNDDGRYVSTNTSHLKDLVFCLGKTINTNQIPIIPNKKLIGIIKNKINIPTMYNITSNGKGINNLNTVLKLINEKCRSNQRYTLNIQKGFYYFDGKINNTLQLDNMNVKNITVILNGHESIFDGKNNTQILNISSKFNVIIKNITFKNGKEIFGGAIYNQGNINISYCTFTNNHAVKGAAIFNRGVLKVTNSIFTYNEAMLGYAIYNKAKIFSNDNNWWATNKPSWNKLLTKVKKLNTYIVMKLFNTTKYHNSRISFKVTINQLNNSKYASIPTRYVRIKNSINTYNQIIKVNGKYKFAYYGKPSTNEVKMDDEIIKYPIHQT